MEYDVLEARYVRDYVVWVRCRDGTSGEVDLGPELHGEVFEPLKDVDYFRRFVLDPELHTLTWPNGADVAPEYFHDNAVPSKEPVARPVREPTRSYAVLIEEGPNSFGASVPDLPGCVAVGKSPEEVERLIKEAIELHIAGLREDGLPVPEPRTTAATVEVP